MHQLMLSLLESNEESYQQAYPSYRAFLDARASRRAALPKAVAAQSVEAPGAGAGAAATAGGGVMRGALLKASAMIQEVKSTQQPEVVRTTYPEMNRDPRLFRVPLMATGSHWDSQLATAREGSSTRLEPFIARLPEYSAEGANTLVLRAEYFSLPDERSYAAVHIGPVPPASNPVKELSREVHLHVAFRVDPSKGGGGLRQRYIQTYKTRGAWEEGANACERKAWGAGQWPFTPKKEFWLRLTLAPEGCYSYVDGVAMAFTPHPAGGLWRPASDPNLHVMLPVAGDTAEKPTWKVREAFWGHCAVSEEAAALAAQWRHSAGAQQRKEAIADELWVTGLTAAAEERDIKEAFAAHASVVRVVLDKRGGAAVQLGGLEGEGAASQLEHVIASTHRQIVVLGATLNVVQAHRMVQVGGGAAGGR